MRRKSKKRPCCICRKWFLPDPRVGERQKTCGEKDCQKKRHAQKCSQWNRQNPVYFREIYLNKKLAAVNETSVSSPHLAEFSVKSRKLPRKSIQEVISAQHLVIIEYVNQLLFRSFQETILRQLAEITRERRQLLPGKVLRGDSRQRGP